MNDNDTKRIPRLIAILTQLQTKRLLTAKSLADKFKVSARTIYRDIKALEQAGVPIFTEEGKGYSLMEDYRLPPVMLTEGEASALITAEQLVLKNKDTSFIKEYTEAITKIKSVLRHHTNDKVNLLAERIHFRQNNNDEKTSNYLSDLQYALTNFYLIEIIYTDEAKTKTQRKIEPFALYSTQDNWLLIAYCKLRKDFRVFRLDRIQSLTILSDKFEPHKMTLKEYFEICTEKYSPTPLP
ncbi:helix-turn-helix transcriptional regulator [Belliella marina]|uniref:Helix-turn-helix transcriptional regulator n=1 Tax=Belliella marina TaxID=1644146 RepID=A0ABW4VT12_9BACT